MKLKAPPGVGDPCVAGVTLSSCDGVYEVEPNVGALLIECFGFVAAAGEAPANVKAASGARRGKTGAKAAARKA